MVAPVGRRGFTGHGNDRPVDKNRADRRGGDGGRRLTDHGSGRWIRLVGGALTRGRAHVASAPRSRVTASVLYQANMRVIPDAQLHSVAGVRLRRKSTGI